MKTYELDQELTVKEILDLLAQPIEVYAQVAACEYDVLIVKSRFANNFRYAAPEELTGLMVTWQNEDLGYVVIKGNY